MSSNRSKYAANLHADISSNFDQGVDLSRWAVVAHKDDTGFGRMAADVRTVLGVGHHVVIPSERLSDHPLSCSQEVLLTPQDPEQRVRSVLQGLQGIIFFERHSWHPALLPIARQMGILTVCIPMWEWFKGDDEQWQWCDLFACPTRFTLEVVQQYGWKNAVYLPWPLDLARFPARKVSTPARLFIHNAGVVDRDDRKGTHDTINAFKRVHRTDIRLVVRLQKEAPLPPLDPRIQIDIGNLTEPGELYTQGDVAIQPSKMEGIGFMILEPLASGMPVLTTDYPPMNEFAQHAEMLVHKQWFKRKAYATNWIKHAHLRLPQLTDLARKIEWCAQSDLTEIAETNRRWAESTFAPDKLRQEWTSVLTSLVVNKCAG